MQLMFDSNIFDDLISGNIEIEFTDDVSIYVTHIQIDEINNCSDSDKRARLFLIMVKIKAQVVSTESSILGVSRLGSARLSGDNMLESLRKGNIKRTNDALIGETAIKNKLTLVTNDIELKRNVENLGGLTISLCQLIELTNK